MQAIAAAPAVQAHLLTLCPQVDVGIQHHIVLILTPWAAHPGVQAGLLALGRSSSWQVRWAVVRALRPHAPDPTIRQYCIRCLGDDCPGVRRTAVTALTPSAELPAVQGALVLRIADAASGVAHAARVALGPYAAAPVVFAGLRPLADHPNPEVRATVAATLARCATTAGVQPVVQQLLADPVARVRRTGIEALRTEVTQPRILAMVLEHCTDVDAVVRESVVHTIGSKHQRIYCFFTIRLLAHLAQRWISPLCT